ncbi:MAG: nucleotidyltransferase family protein [Kordiimonadaceae bacterium]|nr:nucleotidyltransferase family protein [Kordiimonadaceae bacterium]
MINQTIKQTIEILIRTDARALQQLKLVADIGPKASFIAAGFVRNRVWDALYDPKPVAAEADVDVVYFCQNDVSPECDYAYEADLEAADPNTDWQVRNQARMHDFGGHEPFVSLDNALMYWPETATSVGVRLHETRENEFVAPFGFDDLQNHILRIAPAMKAKNPQGFDVRLKAKGWLKRWPRLRVIR